MSFKCEIDKGICYANDGIVSLSISHLKDKSAPIIHEVTHILANHKYNSFYSEGLAVYFQERFGESHGFPNFSLSLDALVKNYEDQLLRISQLHNDNEIFEMIGTEQRKIAYIEAGSFINFLVEKYGEKKLADLNNSSSLNYKKIYGKEMNALEAEWKNHVLKK
ncbi:peptidase MA family metallohydrolase [Thermodesulfobacteriota bacterium]